MPQVNGSVAAQSALDSPDYDPVDHLNAIFSHPTTLSSAPNVSHALQSYQHGLDLEISSLVTKQSASDATSLERMQAAQAELAALFAKVDGVRARALHTEQSITEMTAEIKRLDSTKRNLTLSMTALKRLQMLTTAYEQLRALGKSRQYRECAQLLQAVIQLMAHFRSYRSIDQIATLGKKVADLQRELLEQVCEDFEMAFSRGEVAAKKSMLAEACLVLDALGDNARSRLITWYCNASLREYRTIFRGNDEAGSLDNISRRYAWFNRLLKTYDVEHATIFPMHWRVNEMLANSFCETTRDDFKGILQRSARRADGQTLDVNLLLSCLQETLDFEHSLERRFATRSSVDTIMSAEEKPHAFHQAISEAFEPYLSLWVEAQDRQLATMIPKYRQQPLRSPEEEFSSQLVINSSTELFQFYRLTLAQCAKLSTGIRLLELTKTFAKYLDQYSQQVLFYSLGERSGPQGPSIEDAVLVLNTADYCYLTCTQLEEKITARIDEEYKSNVDLQSQGDAFMGIASAAVRALVRKVEQDCEPAWREMRNTGWAKLENVGDQSSYVGELVRLMRTRSHEILALLYKPQYARAFCDNIVDAITAAYLATVALCKPISEVGAEQMLLDSYVLKKAFTDLPSLAPTPLSPQAQAAYAKRVAQTASKLDPLLKTLQVRPVPPEALVQAYLIHIADRSEANFRKLLDLKGVARRQDQAALVELFHAHRAGQEDVLPASSPLLASLPAPAPASLSSSVSAAAASGAHSILPASNPAGPGISSLLDRFGSPANVVGAATQGGSNGASPARVASPPSTGAAPAPVEGVGGVASTAAGNLNDNLRNIGKFFRRDMGGFGRFGKGSASEEAR